MTKLSDKQVSSKNNGSKQAFSKNDGSMQVFRRNNNNTKFKFSGNTIKYIKKSRKSKSQNIFKFWYLAKLR